MKLAKRLLILFIIIILVFSLIKVAKVQDIILENIYPLEYAEYVEKYSEEFNVDKHYIYSIIKAESNYDAQAESAKGAIGLMQLLPTTATEIANKLEINLEEGILNSPDLNIMIGTKYFSDLLKMYDNEMLALAAYNAGPRKSKQMDI